jgi:exodeoxyribonuclease V alpha subunit
MKLSEPLSAIEGTVKAVVFRNEENGYTVLHMDAGEQGEVTVVGCMPGAAPGEGLTVHGAWARHSSFGEQFKAEIVERRMPRGEKAVFDYLASGAVRGVGAATARRMVDEFGEDALSVLEEKPEQMTRIRGITRKKALAMGEAFRLQMGMRRLLDFFTVHDLPLRLAMPLYRRFGNRALEALRENPYLLLEGEEPVEFGAADGLALSLGLEGDSPMRIQAGLLFELSHNLSNGHTFLPRSKLTAATAQLLAMEEESIGGGLEELLARGEVVRDDIAGEEACYLRYLHECECYVAHRLREMCGTEFLPPKGLDVLIDQIGREQEIVYAPKQREAVRLAARRQVMLLTGGPGMGKTTSLRGVLAMLERLGLNTALAAPTGRAAKRLGEACGVEASTIHRLLGTQFDPATGQLVFSHDEDDPLSADAVIVDETSMVDLVLMRALLAALRGDCRLILVGDPDQLPSVGAGNVISDLLRSGIIPTVRLTEIFRQAAESAIVMNAHEVNRGEMPNLRSGQGDFFFLRRQDPESAVQTIVELCSTRLPGNMGIPADQIQVLTPTRKRATGTAALNRALQAAVNPPGEGKRERRLGDAVFREGDRVMQIRNNYDMIWYEKNGTQSGMGVFNGDIGAIAEIDGREDTVTVDFDGRLVTYSAEQLGELETAYAVTVHKAQGSEYRAVVFAATDAPPMLLTRGVLYTAITRARELFIAVGDERVIGRMTANNRQQRRYSALRARLAASPPAPNEFSQSR